VDKNDVLEIRSLLENISTGTLTVLNVTKGTSFDVSVALSEREAEIMAAGGLLNLMSLKNK